MASYDFLFDDLGDPSEKPPSAPGTNFARPNKYDSVFEDLAPPDERPQPPPEKPGIFEEYVKPALHTAGSVLSTPYRVLAQEPAAALTGLVKTGDPLSEFKLTPEARDRGTLGDIAAEFGLAAPTHVEASPYEGALKPAVQRATRALAGYDEETGNVPLDPGSEATLQARNKGLFTAEKVGDILGELGVQMAADPLLASLSAAGKAAKIGELADVILETKAVPSVAVQLLKDAGIDVASGALKPDLVPTLAALSQKGKEAALAGRVIGASFLPGMGLGAAEKLGSAPESIRQHGLVSPQAAEALVGGAVDLGFTAFGAKHALRPGEHLSPQEQALFDKQVDDLVAEKEQQSRPQPPPLPPGVMSPELQQAFVEQAPRPADSLEGPIKPPGIETLPTAYGMPWEQSRTQAPELPWQADKLAPTDEALAADAARQAALNTPPPAVPPGMLDVWPGRARPIEAPVGVDERSAMLQAAADRDLLDRVEADRAAKQEAADQALLERVQAEKAAKEAAQARVNEIRAQNAMAALEAQRTGQPVPPPPDLSALIPEEQQAPTQPPSAAARPETKELARLVTYQAVSGERGVGLEQFDSDVSLLEALLEKGKLTPEKVAASGIASTLDTGALRLLKDAVKADPAGVVASLREVVDAKRSEAPAPPPPVVQPAPTSKRRGKMREFVGKEGVRELTRALAKQAPKVKPETSPAIEKATKQALSLPSSEVPVAPPFLPPGFGALGAEGRFPESVPPAQEAKAPREPRPQVPSLPPGFGAMGAEPGRPKTPTPRVPPGFGEMGAEGRFPERIPQPEPKAERPKDLSASFSGFETGAPNSPNKRLNQYLREHAPEDSGNVLDGVGTLKGSSKAVYKLDDGGLYVVRDEPGEGSRLTVHLERVGEGQVDLYGKPSGPVRGHAWGGVNKPSTEPEIAPIHPRPPQRSLAEHLAEAERNIKNLQPPTEGFPAVLAGLSRDELLTRRSGFRNQVEFAKKQSNPEALSAAEGRLAAAEAELTRREALRGNLRQQKAAQQALETGKLYITQEELQKALSEAGDVYKDAKMRPNEIGQYEFRPELFRTSDLSGKPIRHYVKLPDGRIAHPDEIHEARQRGRVVIESEPAPEPKKTKAVETPPPPERNVEASENVGPTVPEAPRTKQATLPGGKPEKINKSTGFTNSQESYVADKIEEAAAAGKDQVHIKVPGDGELDLVSKETMSRLHKTLTGEPLEGIPVKTSLRAERESYMRVPPSDMDELVASAIHLYGDSEKAAKIIREQVDAMRSRGEEVNPKTESLLKKLDAVNTGSYGTGNFMRPLEDLTGTATGRPVTPEARELEAERARRFRESEEKARKAWEEREAREKEKAEREAAERVKQMADYDERGVREAEHNAPNMTADELDERVRRYEATANETPKALARYRELAAEKRKVQDLVDLKEADRTAAKLAKMFPPEHAAEQLESAAKSYELLGTRNPKLAQRYRDLAESVRAGKPLEAARNTPGPGTEARANIEQDARVARAALDEVNGKIDALREQREKLRTSAAKTAPAKREKIESELNVLEEKQRQLLSSSESAGRIAYEAHLEDILESGDAGQKAIARYKLTNGKDNAAHQEAEQLLIDAIEKQYPELAPKGKDRPASEEDTGQRFGGGVGATELAAGWESSLLSEGLEKQAKSWGDVIRTRRAAHKASRVIEDAINADPINGRNNLPPDIAARIRGIESDIAKAGRGDIPEVARLQAEALKTLEEVTNEKAAERAKKDEGTQRAEVREAEIRKRGISPPEVDAFAKLPAASRAALEKADLEIDRLREYVAPERGGKALVDRGIMRPDMTLTEKGRQIAQAAQDFLFMISKGLRFAYHTDAPPTGRELLDSIKHGGKGFRGIANYTEGPFYTNGHFLVFGDRPKGFEVEDIGRSSLPDKVIEKAMDRKKLKPVTPEAIVGPTTPSSSDIRKYDIVLSNGKIVDRMYFDHVRQKFPDADLYWSSKAEALVLIEGGLDKAKRPVAVVMGKRGDGDAVLARLGIEGEGDGEPDLMERKRPEESPRDLVAVHNLNEAARQKVADRLIQEGDVAFMARKKAGSKEEEREQRLKFWRAVVDDQSFPEHLREHIRQSLAEEETKPPESTPASKLKRDDLLDRAEEEAEATAVAGEGNSSVEELTTGERAVRAAAAQKIVDRAAEADTDDARSIEALGLSDRKEARLLSRTVDRLRIDSPVYDQVSRRLQDLVSKGALRLDRAQAVVDSIQEKASRAGDRASSFLDRLYEARSEDSTPELRAQVAEEARRFLEEKKARAEKGYAFKPTEGSRTADVKARVKVAEARLDKVELGDKVNIASPDEAHDAIAESLGATLGYEPAKAIRRAADSLAGLVSRTIGKKAPGFLGLTVDGGAHGYSLPEGVRVNVLAEWERAQFRAGLKKTEAGQSVEREAARGIVNVLIHEIAHATVKGHGKAHDAEMLRIMRAVSGEPLLKLRAAIEAALKGKDVGSVLGQAKEVWGETGKRGGRDRRADRGVSTEGRDRPGAGAERVADREGGGPRLAEAVPTGSRGEAGDVGAGTQRAGGEPGVGDFTARRKAKEEADFWKKIYATGEEFWSDYDPRYHDMLRGKVAALESELASAKGTTVAIGSRKREVIERDLAEAKSMERGYSQHPYQGQAAPSAPDPSRVVAISGTSSGPVKEIGARRPGSVTDRDLEMSADYGIGKSGVFRLDSGALGRDDFRGVPAEHDVVWRDPSNPKKWLSGRLEDAAGLKMSGDFVPGAAKFGIGRKLNIDEIARFMTGSAVKDSIRQHLKDIRDDARMGSDVQPERFKSGTKPMTVYEIDHGPDAFNRYSYFPSDQEPMKNWREVGVVDVPAVFDTWAPLIEAFRNPDLMERAPGIPEPAPGIPQPKEPEKQEAKPAPGQPGFERRPIRPIPPEAAPVKPETAGMLPKGLDTGVVIQYIPKGGGPAREGMVIHAPKGGTVDVKLDGRPGIVKLPEADLKAIGHLKDSLMRPRSRGITAEQSRAALGRAWADKEPGDISGNPSEGTAPFNLNHLALSPDNREKMARIWKASKDEYEKAAGRRTLEDIKNEGEELLRQVGGRGTVEEAVKAGVPLGDGKFVHAARLVLAEQARELNEAGAKMREAARTGVGKAEAEKELLLRALEHANYSLAFRGAQAQAARALAAFRIATEETGTIQTLLRRAANWTCGWLLAVLTITSWVGGALSLAV